MDRKKTTEFIGKLLVSDRLGGRGKYWAKEVSIDYGTKNVKRVDFMQFKPAGVMSVSEIESSDYVELSHATVIVKGRWSQ